MTSTYGKRTKKSVEIKHSEYKDFETLSYFELENQHKLRSNERFANTKMATDIRYRVELYEVNGTTENIGGR